MVEGYRSLVKRTATSIKVNVRVDEASSSRNWFLPFDGPRALNGFLGLFISFAESLSGFTAAKEEAGVLLSEQQHIESSIIAS